MTFYDELRRDREAGTPGPWESRLVRGWGDTQCITPQHTTKPFAQLIRPKDYYTDFPKVTNSDGSTSVSISERAAKEAGNYVATPEIKNAIEARQDADSRRFARVPVLEDIALAAEELAAAVDHERNMVCQDLDMQLQANNRVEAALAKLREATA